MLEHTRSDELVVRMRATRAVAVLCHAHGRSHGAVLAAGGVKKLLAAVRAHVEGGEEEEAEEVALWALRALSSCAVDHVACRRRLVASGAADVFETFAVLGSSEVVKRDAAAASACCADESTHNGESSFKSGLRAASISAAKWHAELHGPGL